jgi:hypothetical protein
LTHMCPEVLSHLSGWVRNADCRFFQCLIHSVKQLRSLRCDIHSWRNSQGSQVCKHARRSTLYPYWLALTQLIFSHHPPQTCWRWAKQNLSTSFHCACWLVFIVNAAMLQKTFTIDPVSGRITTAQGLDRDYVVEMSFDVIATDRAQSAIYNLPQTATSTSESVSWYDNLSSILMEFISTFLYCHSYCIVQHVQLKIRICLQQESCKLIKKLKRNSIKKSNIIYKIFFFHRYLSW